jgi:hypothetical protein
MSHAFRLLPALLTLSGIALLHCNSSSSNTGGANVNCSTIGPDADFYQDAGACYPDNDGITGGSYTIDLVVDDTGFLASGGDDAGTKNIIATQNDAQVTLTLTNNGTKPHGFEVEPVNVCSVYPSLPAGCSPNASFPAGSTISTLAPGASVTVTFVTPTPDGLLYPFKSAVAADSTVPGLNEGQWSLM